MDSLLDRATQLVSSYLKAERTSWMQVADSNKARLESLQRGITSWIDRTEEEIRAAFASLATRPEALAFRNKSELSVEDMARILDKLERLNAANPGNEPEAQ